MRRLALLAVLALAGCGGASDRIPAPVAAKLARQADAVAAAGGACAASARARTLQAQTIAAINSGRIPARFQEALQARANELVSELEPRCLPTPAARSPEPPPQPRPVSGRPRPPAHGHGHDHGHGPPKGKHDHGHGHGHGPGHGHGRGDD